MNIYQFTGRLARDCEVRVAQGGMSICSFSVAVDYGFGKNKGTNWIRVSIFGARAEGNLPKYLLKGTQIAVSGGLRVREYTDNNGQKRTSVDVRASSVDLIGGAVKPATSQSNISEIDLSSIEIDPSIPF